MVQIATSRRHILPLLVILLSSACLDAFAIPSSATSHAESRRTIKSTSPSIRSIRRNEKPSPNLSHPRLSYLSLRAGAVDGGADDTGSNPVVRLAKGLNQWAQKNFFLAGLFLVLTFAKLFPSWGVNGSFLRPELTVGKYGVGLIFLLSGLSLQGSELTKAVSNMKLNGLIQAVIFAAWPFLVGNPLKRVLNSFSVLPPGLVDGLLILTCLPTTVNMCIMLTSACNGNVAASICNAVISNMIGILVTPALLLHFFGTSIQLPFLQMVKKLCQKVLLPVAVGQALRATKAKAVYESNSKMFKRLQEVILLGIVWNAFCTAFTSGLGLQFHHTLILLTLLPVMHLGSLGILFQFFSIPALKFSRKDVVAAAFCASQKTLAFGLPLINTIFEGNANLASFVAPLMFIHPLQMTLGSILIPRISKYTSEEGKEE